MEFVKTLFAVLFVILFSRACPASASQCLGNTTTCQAYNCSSHFWKDPSERQFDSAVIAPLDRFSDLHQQFQVAVGILKKYGQVITNDQVSALNAKRNSFPNPLKLIAVTTATTTSG